jgi:hypothetical protein
MASKQIQNGTELVLRWPDIHRDRIVAIGARWEGVKCVDWQSPEIPNIADYDVVIVNCRPLTELIEQWKQTPPPMHLWEALFKHQAELASKLRRVLDSQGQVWALVDPCQHLEIPRISRISTSMDNWGWNPWPVRARSERGESKQVREPRLEAYFSHLPHWRFALELAGDIVSKDVVVAQFGREAWAEPVVTPVAVTREGRPIAMSVHYRVRRPEGSELSRALHAPPEVVFASGSVVYLPLPEGEADVRAALESSGYRSWKPLRTSTTGGGTRSWPRERRSRRGRYNSDGITIGPTGSESSPPKCPLAKGPKSPKVADDVQGSLCACCQWLVQSRWWPSVCC